LVIVPHGALVVAVWGPNGAAVSSFLLLVLSVVTAYRVSALVRYRPPRRWVTDFVDLPLLCHAGSALGGLVAAGIGIALGLGAMRLGRLGYLVALPLFVWSIWGKPRTLSVRSMEVPVVGLRRAFDGYRIVQLSDLHLGPFQPLARALDWVRAANRVGADLCVVTGDLMARESGSVSEVLTALGALRARDGVLVVLGNHDRPEAPRLTCGLRERGITVLRNEWHRIERGLDELWVLGIDDWRSRPGEVDGLFRAGHGREPVLFLAHRHDERIPYGRFGLGLFGHTHGGQIGLPWVARRANIVTLTGQRAQGLFRIVQGWAYITAGLGTSGPPMRFGIAPEIAVLVLREETTSMHGQP
jgi:uncharacterized protein